MPGHRNRTPVQARLVVALLLVLGLLGCATLTDAKAKVSGGKQNHVDFYGRPIDPHVAALVREFNLLADNGAFDSHSLYQFRKEMNNFGLNGKVSLHAFSSTPLSKSHPCHHYHIAGGPRGARCLTQSGRARQGLEPDGPPDPRQLDARREDRPMPYGSVLEQAEGGL